MMLCMALVFYSQELVMQRCELGRVTYHRTCEVSEKHAVVLVVPPVDLSEVCLEVRDNRVVLIGAIAVRGDTEV